MVKFRRIVALIAAIIMIGLYVLTLVSAFFVRTEFGNKLFYASLTGSIVFSIITYGLSVFMKSLSPTVEVLQEEKNGNNEEK